jgi:SNF2 family DNA or RNA helicase
MSLRQIVCHPYIINREEIDPDDERTAEQEEERKKKLVETSGKLILLRDMLKKLHGTEHRVLIFSQFISVLSILEEFLEDLEYKFVKLVSIKITLRIIFFFQTINCMDYLLGW